MNFCATSVFTEVYLKPVEHLRWSFSAKIVDDWNPLTIFIKKALNTLHLFNVCNILSRFYSVREKQKNDKI